LGLSAPHEVAFLLPERHLDLSAPVAAMHDLPEGVPACALLTVASTPEIRWPTRGGKGARPRTVFTVRMASGETVRATIFGDTRDILDTLKIGRPILAILCLTVYQEVASLVIDQIVPTDWHGRVMPIYKGIPRTLTSESVAQAVTERLPRAIPEAATVLRTLLAGLGPVEHLLADLGASGWTLEQLLHQAHHPQSLSHGEYARTLCLRVAALANLIRLQTQHGADPVPPIPLPTLASRLASAPLTPTDDQRAAITDIATQLALPCRMRHAVIGDVSTGKTFVAGVIAAACADAAAQVVMLLPNARLCAQVAADFRAWFPDLTVAEITSDSVQHADLSAPIIVGTSALLHRPELPAARLVICDEQHRFSRAQREQLLGEHTHLLELTATPIPRSQALLQLGRMSVSEMRQTHAPKSILTRIHLGDTGQRAFFQELLPAVRSGDPLLVVYPKRDITPDPDQPEQAVIAGVAPSPARAPEGSDRYSVAAAAARWEKAFPGYVATLTSDDDDATKAQVLSDFTEGKIRILLCTTVVEVGLNLPTLYRIAIVRPELHGLMSLHQLRGRVARRGGEGFCELLCPEPLTPDQMRRLEFFASTSDGFTLAEFDLTERGAGDLSRTSAKQSGSDDSFLFGVKLEMQHLTEVLPVFDAWRGAA
jgi:ATP-dependent DNA helicase RecG